MEDIIATAEAIEDNRLIVWSPKEGSNLFAQGFYGKPLGISKPKETEFEVPVMLDLIEGVYLLEKRRIRVIAGEEKRELSLGELSEAAQRVHDGFDLKYKVYKDLREKGYVVSPGIKYGCDFAVYEQGPGLDHAPYIVQVKRREEELPASEIVKVGRLAATVRKTFIMALVDACEGTVIYLGFKWWKA